VVGYVDPARDEALYLQFVVTIMHRHDLDVPFGCTDNAYLVC
jgi:hypothetical protein